MFRRKFFLTVGFGFICSIQSIARETALQPQAFISNAQYFSSSTTFYKTGGATNSVSLLGLQWNPNQEVNIQAFYSFAEDLPYFKVKDLNYEIRVWNSNLILGRKWLPWSDTHDLWQTGIWQSRFMFNKLNMESQGLTGLFLEKKWSASRLVFFGSPLFIPERTVPSRLVDGHFESKNPWYQSPFKTLVFNGVPTDVKYEIDAPKMSEVVNRVSAGVYAEHEISQDLVKFGYAYKPMNQYLLSFDNHVLVPSARETYVGIKLRPRWIYHHLATAEHTHTWSEHVQTKASGTVELPQSESYDGERTYQSARKNEYTELAGEYFFKEVGRGSSLYLSLYKVWGGDGPDKGVLAAEPSLFPSQIAYYEAAMIALKEPQYGWLSDRWSSSASLIYDRMQRGLVWKLMAQYQVEKSLAVRLEGQMLGLVDAKTPQIRDGIIEKFRSNDNLEARLIYAF